MNQESHNGSGAGVGVLEAECAACNRTRREHQPGYSASRCNFIERGPAPPATDAPEKPRIHVGTIGHVDHGKTTLTAALTKVARMQDATPPAGGGELPVSRESVLRAMATNYAGGHSWDHLDSETCIAAADEIAALRCRLASGGGADPQGDLYDTILAAVDRGAPRQGSILDDFGITHKLLFREREHIAGCVFQAVHQFNQSAAGARVGQEDGVLAPIIAELARAMRKFPTWPTDPLHAVAVLGEEYGELDKAVLQAVYEPHKSTTEDVRSEAIQTAAMAIRFVASLDSYEYARCPQHQQPALPAAPTPETPR